MGTNITESKQNLWLREQLQDNGNKSISSTGTKLYYYGLREQHKIMRNKLIGYKIKGNKPISIKGNKTVLLWFKEQ
jgi:hypothetical protein